MKKKKQILIWALAIVIAILLIVLLSSIAASIGSKNSTSVKIDSDKTVAAYVNSEPIYLEDIQSTYHSLVYANQKNIKYYTKKMEETKDEYEKEFYQSTISSSQNNVINPIDILDTMIEKKIIDQQILKHDITISSDEIDKIREGQIETNKIIKESAASGDENAICVEEVIEEFIETSGLSEEELLDNQVTMLVQGKLRYKYSIYIIEKKFGDGSYQINNNDQQEYYDEHCKKLRKRAKIKILKELSIETMG